MSIEAADSELGGFLTARPRSPFALAMGRLLRKKLAVLALFIIATIYLGGIIGPFVSPYGFNEQNLDRVREGPSLQHPLGTDWNGRDMLTRVLWSARTTVIMTVATIFSGSLILGISLGLLAGYLGGRVDNIIMRIGDIFLGLPTLLILILITGTVRFRIVEIARDINPELVRSGAVDYFLIVGSLSIFAWVGTARIIRSQVLALRDAEYVLAARALGASVWRIIGVHLFPNIIPLVIVGLSASLGFVAISEVSLSWFGIGIQPPRPSFGRMIAEYGSFRILEQFPHLVLVPGLTVALLIFAFNLLGDALNDAINPRRR